MIKIIKKIFATLVIYVMLLLLGGGISQGVSATNADVLTLSPTSLELLGGSSGIRQITVTSNGIWSNPTISVNARDWLSIENVTPTDRRGNGSIGVRFQRNPGTQQRSGTITVTQGNITRRIDVIQSGGPAPPVLTLSTDNEILRPTATTTNNRPTIMITSNTTWNMPTSDANWLTVSNVNPTNRTGNGSFIINAAANTDAQRTGTITVTGGGITRTVTVTQIGAANVTLSPSTVTLGAGASNATINVTSNTWGEPTSNVDWLTISHITPANRIGNGSFRINATANQGERREARVNVSGSVGGLQGVTVVQEAAPGTPSLEVCQDLVQFNRLSSTTINVTSNSTWSVPASDASWLTVSQIAPSNLTGNGSFRINATENNTGASRSGTITLSSGRIIRTVRVVQFEAEGLPTLNLQTEWGTSISGRLSASSRASYRTINVVSNDTWSIPTSNVPWLTVSHISPANRTGNGSFRINIAANSNPGIDREGMITISAGGRVRTVTISQNRYYIWHSDLSIVGFWPGTINTSVQTHGNVARNMNTFLDHVNREWANALGVSINRTTPAQANIQNHVGRRGPLAAYMRTQRYHIAVSANTICTGRYLGLAFVATRNHAGSIACREGWVRSVQMFSGVAVTFNSYDNIDFSPHNDVRLQHLLLHEVGHSLGWEGHSSVRGDVMYRREVQNVIHLTPQEALHLRQIYDAFSRSEVILHGNGGGWGSTPTGWTRVAGTASNVTEISRTQAVSSVVNWPTNPTRSGYVFGGWSPALSNLWPNSATTYRAQWAPLTQVVTFNPQGGTWPAPAGGAGNQQRTILRSGTYAQAFNASGTLLNPTQNPPTRLNYTFAGWWSAATGGVQILPTTQVTNVADRTLHARWTPILQPTQIVTFNPQGGTWPAPAGGAGNQQRTILRSGTYAQAFNASGTLLNPTQNPPTRPNHTFAGWWSAATGGVQIHPSDSVTNVANRTLHARWTPIPQPTQVVTFNPQRGTWPAPAGGTGNQQRTILRSGTYGQAFNASGALLNPLQNPPTRENHIFLGWWSAATGGVQIHPSTPVTNFANRTLHARWGPAQVVTFNPQGGTWPAPAGGTGNQHRTILRNGTYAQAFNASDVLQNPVQQIPIRDGFVFIGWWTEPGGGRQVRSSNAVSNEAVRTLHARWVRR